MGQFSSFDELPLIVHDGILCSLASPRDVANTIRASPGSLQAFVNGRRNVVLLATLQNYLSLENQHLMNLVMAAPHYYKHGETDNESTTSTCVEFDGVPRDDFDRALREFLHNLDLHDDLSEDLPDDLPDDLHESNMRPLTMNTLPCAIRIYAIMDKEVRNYGLFALARSQRRVDELSNPRMFSSHRQSPDCAQPAPNDRETRRIWRGFLIHELFCIMFGIPEISAAASNEGHFVVSNEIYYYLPRERDDIREFVRKISAPVVEELICIQQYVRDQYELAFNEVVDRFKLAVSEKGRRASSPSMPSKPSITSVVELTRGNSPKPVRYLLEPLASPATSWRDHMAMLGVSFLHEFFSWDSTARLDFIRATYPFLSKRDISDFGELLMHGTRVSNVEGFHSLFLHSDFNHFATRRLRAVGWIFWENPDRLASMNLVQGSAVATYSSWKGLLVNLILRVPSVLVEKPLEPEDWEHVIREFGTPYNDTQPTTARALFKSTGTLNRTKVAEIVSASLQRVVEHAAAEARNEWE